MYYIIKSEIKKALYFVFPFLYYNVHMITIGFQKIKTNIFMAPLSGCADLSFRLMMRMYGAQFCFFEMVDANAILHRHAKTVRLLRLDPKDTPIAAQLLGSSASQMLDAAYQLLSYAPVSFIDINSACPVKKVIKKKSGAYLLKDIPLLEKIIQKMASTLPVPVTVKLRIGFEAITIKSIITLAKKCEAAGAGALFVHGRTRQQGYSGDINYKGIAAIKKHVAIPVFGSGNILSPFLAKKMFDETGCDGILVARGAFGNPWIFKDIGRYLKTGTVPSKKNLMTKISALKKHLSYVDTYNEFRGPGKIGFMRKVAQWYLTGFPDARKLRAHVTHVDDYERLVKVIESLSPR
ncbi:MAG: tRNA dihydrouridine synthase DusB [Candidatus Omnitrophota bacterium]